MGIQIFTSSGTYTPGAGVNSIKVLVVGGGGGGGGYNIGGGGGAGGLIYRTNYSVIPGNHYTVTIGQGGVGGVGGSGHKGTNGNNSVFDLLTAIGGGGGAYGVPPDAGGSALDGLLGGSGGGGGGTDTPPAGSGGAGTVLQGYAGANGFGGEDEHGHGIGYGGGGGGAGGAATDLNGANGVQYSISGSPQYYAGGGGGGQNNVPGIGGLGGGGNGGRGNPGNSGGYPATYYGGGGGGSGGNEPAGTGGSGYQGIVIVDDTVPLSGFSSNTVADGTPVISTVHPTTLVSTILAYATDAYFDNISKIHQVIVYYKSSDGRQVKRIIHNAADGFAASVTWEPGADDGPWQKYMVKTYDGNGAENILPRAGIGTNEDLSHTGYPNGTMTLNT